MWSIDAQHLVWLLRSTLHMTCTASRVAIACIVLKRHSLGDPVATASMARHSAGLFFQLLLHGGAEKKPESCTCEQRFHHHCPWSATFFLDNTLHPQLTATLSSQLEL